MTWKVFLMSIVGGLAVLLQFEVQNDILYVEKEVVLPGGRAKTFLYLSDLRNFKYWFPGIDSFDPVDDTVMGVGKRFTETAYIKFYGNMSSACTILGYEPPQLLSYVCDSWLTRPRIEMTLKHNEDNAKYPTTLVYKEYSRRRSYLFNAWREMRFNRTKINSSHINHCALPYGYAISPVISYMYSYLRRQALFSLRYHLQDR